MCSIHIYLHFIVHPDCQLSTLHNISQNEITNTVYYKLPFIIDGTNILHPIDLDKYTKVSKKEYSKTYESILLLEPLVKFFTNDTVYDLKKGKKIPTHHNLECRNFYIVHKGNIRITCINPKHKEGVNLELKENQILFVPNYWKVQIKSISSENSIIEKLQYSTIMNQANFLWHYISNIKTSSICI